MLTIAVITVSDRASRGEYEDKSGPAVVAALRESLSGCLIDSQIIPDEQTQIEKTLREHLQCDWIITTGGSGISPRDVTPEATREICDQEIPGIAEWLRQESLKETPHAVFSRGFCGIAGKTIIVNLPGSVKGASFCARLLAKVMEHGTSMLQGGGH